MYAIFPEKLAKDEDGRRENCFAVFGAFVVCCDSF
jgi:hypothetical protein